VSLSDFTHLAIRSDAGKAERLFRAAISAFCALSHPSREALDQLDDLALPLYDDVSPEALRFASAALSECKRAPAGLIRRLAQEEIHIAAPVLMRSAVLSETDLMTIVTRKGAAHARAIAIRPNLSDPLQRLLERTAATAVTINPAEHRSPDPQPSLTDASSAGRQRSDGAAEAAREKLRLMMAANAARIDDIAPAAANGDPETAEGSAFRRLREASLTGSRPRIRTALAAVLDIGFAETADLVRPQFSERLTAALRSIGLPVEQAFLIHSLMFPGLLRDENSIRRFVVHFEEMEREAALDQVRRLRLESISTALRPARTGLEPPKPAKVLKAS
jgi:uncharacterized protein (DUF2336 family)